MEGICASHTTIPGVLIEMNNDSKKRLDEMMFDYGFMLRYSFKRYLEQEQLLQPKKIQKYVQSLEKELAVKTSYPLHFVKEAVADAVQLVKSQHALMKEYLILWKKRYRNTKKRYDQLLLRLKMENPTKLFLTLRNKMQSQMKKVEFYMEHILKKTFPSVIFGGKINFYKRQKGILTKEQWNEFRNGRMSSRGDATQFGNRNLRVIKTESGFSLQITSNRKVGHGKSSRYEKSIFPLYIATKKDKSSGVLKGRKYPELMSKTLENGSAYEVEILKRNDQYKVHIKVKNEMPPVHYRISSFLGIDTNINGLALSHINEKGYPIRFEWIGDGGLQDYPKNKRENKIWEIAHYVLKYCLSHNIGLAIENLKFIQDKEEEYKRHRKSHQFCYRKLLDCMESLAIRYGVLLIKVKPNYTSIIGRLKYQSKYRINVHHAAALVISRRAIGYREKVPYKLISLLSEKQKVDFHLQNENQKWNIIKQHITILLKKQKAYFHQWHDYKKLYV